MRNVMNERPNSTTFEFSVLDASTERKKDGDTSAEKLCPKSMFHLNLWRLVKHYRQRNRQIPTLHSKHVSGCRNPEIYC